MPQSVSLLFGVHAHQPIGNFPEVLADAHLRCYKPFLEVLSRYPDFHFAVHFSGWLLDYLFEHYPQDMALLAEMVQRGQVELFGAGDTEPVLAAIPSRDRIGQIETFSRKLEAKLGQRPNGAWLTERVWESTVVPSLVDCGIRYVIVDDYHFLCAGKDPAQLNGFFTTEEDARKLDIFPISEALRYKLPFSPASEAIAYIESLVDGTANNRDATDLAAIYFDDIEKFGIWPETYQWVYEKGWLEQFVQGVLASPKIFPCHYRQYHGANKSKGIIYLPTTSYIEMNEWSLPVESARAYAELIKESKASGWYEDKKAFLRGGIWKNFLSRYPESNWMHKRMLGLSARFSALAEKRRTSEMQQQLYASQANDAYWHGLFGGLYLPHLRRAIYQNMIALEAALDIAEPRAEQFMQDVDFDGVEEAFLHNNKLQIILKPERYASIAEFDAYSLNHNFADTIQRQTEHYFDKIQLGDQLSANADGAASHENSRNGIASAHDRIVNKHMIQAGDLEPDDHPRHLFVDYLDGVLVGYQYDASNAASIRFKSTDNNAPSIGKQFELKDNRLTVSYYFSDPLNNRFSTEINLAMPSCDGPGGHFKHSDKIASNFGQLLKLSNLTEISLDDDTLGGYVVLRTSVPVQLQSQPFFTVSQSESGFEKIMQAVTLQLECSDTTQELVVTLDVHKK